MSRTKFLIVVILVSMIHIWLMAGSQEYRDFIGATWDLVRSTWTKAVH